MTSASGPVAPPGTAPSGTVTSGSDLSADLSVLMGRIVRVLRRAAPVAMGPGSLSALATLDRCGPMRLGDLAAREGVAPPTLTRMVGALEESGYVARRPDPRDRRAVVVSLTPDGETLVARVLEARAEVFRRRMAEMPQEACEALVAAVPALRWLAGDDLPE